MSVLLETSPSWAITVVRVVLGLMAQIDREVDRGAAGPEWVAAFGHPAASLLERECR